MAQRRQRVARRAAPADRARALDLSAARAGVDGDAARSAGRRAAAMGRAGRDAARASGSPAPTRTRGSASGSGPIRTASAIHVPLPGYEASFRAFSNHVVLDAPLSGDAAADAPRVLDAIRQRPRLHRDRRAGHAGQPVVHGDERIAHRRRSASDLRDRRRRADCARRSNAPPGTTLVLLRNGQRVHEVTDGALEMNGGTDAGVYRVEAYTPDAPGGPPVPWIVSNPIYAGLTRHAPPEADRCRAACRAFRRAPPRPPAESGPRRSSSVVEPAPLRSAARTLAGDPRDQLDVRAGAGDCRPAVCRDRGPDCRRPRGVRSRAVQGVVVGADARLGATARAGRQHRAVGNDVLCRYRAAPGRLPFATFMPIGATSSARPPLDRVDSLLFVVDTLNTLPGTPERQR